MGHKFGTLPNCSFYCYTLMRKILVCIITATKLSCNYNMFKGTWLDETSQSPHLSYKVYKCVRSRCRPCNYSRLVT